MFASVATPIETIRHILGRAVISSRDDPPLHYDYCSHTKPLAVRALSNGHRNPHEIFVRIGNIPFDFLHTTSAAYAVCTYFNSYRLTLFQVCRVHLPLRLPICYHASPLCLGAPTA